MVDAQVPTGGPAHAAASLNRCYRQLINILKIELASLRGGEMSSEKLWESAIAGRYFAVQPGFRET